MISQFRLYATVAALAFAASCGGSDAGMAPSVRQVASVEITPQPATIAPSQTVQLNAVARDAGGSALSGRAFVWTATPASVGSVSATGTVSAISPGVLSVVATAEGIRGEVQVTVASNSPVATITLSSSAQTLIPQDTARLSALLKDAAGHILTGRAVVWSASPAATGTVTASGVVTAIAPGTLTVTATSEGQVATMALAVVSGAMVGPTGGTVLLDNGNVQVQVPAGAVSANTRITVVPTAQPSAAPPDGWTSVGPQYELGPVGTVFAQPVTVRFKFRSTDLPAFAMSGDLQVRQASGSQWSTLDSVVIDAASRTVSARTSSFGAAVNVPAAFGAFGTNGESPRAAFGAPAPTTGIGAQNPTVTITPGRASVNAQQRSATFTAAIPPKGTAIPLPANTPAPLFRWSTTGRNGALSGGTPGQWSASTEVQYTATNAVLNQLSGPIDDVKVELLLNPGETDPAKQRIVSATAIVDADLDRTYQLVPSNPEIDAGQSQNLQLLIRDKQGNQLALPPAQSLTWTTSGVFGSIGTPGPRQEVVVYRANSAFTNPPPRIDDVIVKVTEVRNTDTRVFRQGLFGTDGAYDVQPVTRTITVGEARTFVEVKVKYQVTITPSSPTLEQRGVATLTANLSPAYTGPGLMYKWSNTGTQGTLNVSNGTRVSNSSVVYTAKANSIGTDQVRVEVVSVVADVELEMIGSATASVEVRGCLPTFTDPRDGAVYKQVCVGSQAWMAENLRFNAPGSVCFNLVDANCRTYGRLYTRQQAVGSEGSSSNPSNVRGICAEGWHVPSMAEWLELINRFGGLANASPALRSTSSWINPPVPGTNTSGMNMLGAGRGLSVGFAPSFSGLDQQAWYLASDNQLNSRSLLFLQMDREVRTYGLSSFDYHSLRCVKDAGG